MARMHPNRLCRPGATAIMLMLPVYAGVQAATLPAADLSALSFDELANITVMSVSKQPEPLNQAPASIYVISRDDILQSGATTVPEMLRLAPNLLVSQQSAYSYDVTARGFSGNAAAQNFPNKLLVLIDGRSVYSPLYSGVYWDMQNVLPEDIERIEVISGPGSTLWGANAFNGVINIITRGTADSQGGMATLSAGNLGENGSVQYGGKLGADLNYRVYAGGVGLKALETARGTSAQDGMSSGQGGFRLDWTPAEDSVTLQGDLYRGSEEQAGLPDTFIAGENMVGRWRHSLSGGSVVQVQAYYDEVTRSSNGNGGFTVRTADLDLQQSLALGNWNDIVWGGGERISWYDITNTPTLLFVPASRRLTLGNIFVQDGLSLTDALKLSLGVKLEDDPYSGLAILPNARLSWALDERSLVWTSVSRAVRSPTPFDVDVVEYLAGTKFLVGGPDFKPEKVTAYELGYRMQVTPALSFSASAFDNHYDDLRSIEFAPTGLILPLQLGNMMEGSTYGVEIWANWKVLDWWRVSAGLTAQHENLRFKPGASQLLGTAQAGDDPTHHASLQSVARLAENLSWSAELRTVGALPNPAVPAYTELNSRLAWTVLKDLDVSLSGFNLLHDHHQEMTETGNDRIGRSFTIAVRRSF